MADLDAADAGSPWKLAAAATGGVLVAAFVGYAVGRADDRGRTVRLVERHLAAGDSLTDLYQEIDPVRRLERSAQRAAEAFHRGVGEALGGAAEAFHRGVGEALGSPDAWPTLRRRV